MPRTAKATAANVTVFIAPISRSEEVTDRLQNGRGLLLPDSVTSLSDLDQRRFGNRLFEGVTVGRRDQHVLLAPDDQRPGRDPVEPRGQATVGNRKQEL